jgi:sec-independent protein translocase protein TatC
MVFAITGFSGLGFTFSLIFVLLVRLGFVKTTMVTHNRRWFYLGMYIVCAIITPDGGPLADIALFLPIMIIWEISILFARRYERQREAMQAAETPATATTIKCKFCGHRLETSEMFCPNCGKSQL